MLNWNIDDWAVTKIKLNWTQNNTRHILIPAKQDEASHVNEK